MCRYRLCSFVTAACCTYTCQGWVLLTTPGISPQASTFGSGSTRWCCSTYSELPLALPQRVTRGVMLASSGKSRDPGQESQESERRPTAKIIDTPIPDYLIDMLKEAGEIDENGKPLNDFFDPNDDDQFGSKRMRENNAAAEENNYYDIPFGEMLHDEKGEIKEDTGTLMDTTINNAIIEFGFPLEFFLDSLCRWGVTPPINQNVRLGDLIDAEQAAGLCEALTGLDAADVRDNYLDETLEDLAYDLGVSLPDLFQACAIQKINLPQGGYTHITVDEYKLLLDNVVEGGETSPARRLFDETRTSNRWAGQRDNDFSEAFREEASRMIERNNRGFGWRDGPPILGQGEGELPIDAAHIGGRIFGEDAFTLLEEEGDGEDDDDMSEFFDFGHD